MPALVLNIPGDIPGEEGRRGYTMQLTHPSSTQPAASQGDTQFTATKTLHIGNSYVYRGTLDDFYGRYPQDVVCKMIIGDIAPLESEAKIYNTALTKVQGLLAPLFLGHFSVTPPDSDKPIACTYFDGIRGEVYVR